MSRMLKNALDFSRICIHMRSMRSIHDTKNALDFFFHEQVVLTERVMLNCGRQMGWHDGAAAD